MKSALGVMAQEISQSLVREMEGSLDIQTPAPVSFSDLLLHRLAVEVAKRLESPGALGELGNGHLQARLDKAESGLARLARSAPDADEDEAQGTASALPNLKHARPKYSNLESVLKYVEQDQDRGGTRLVIMNFND